MRQVEAFEPRETPLRPADAVGAAESDEQRQRDDARAPGLLHARQHVDAQTEQDRVLDEQGRLRRADPAEFSDGGRQEIHAQRRPQEARTRRRRVGNRPVVARQIEQHGVAHHPVVGLPEEVADAAYQGEHKGDRQGAEQDRPVRPAAPVRGAGERGHRDKRERGHDCARQRLEEAEGEDQRRRDHEKNDDGHAGRDHGKDLSGILGKTLGRRVIWRLPAKIALHAGRRPARR
ncbi:MAG: hypothetical protein V9G24_12215 [Rhodoblastus sp.]